MGLVRKSELLNGWLVEHFIERMPAFRWAQFTISTLANLFCQTIWNCVVLLATPHDHEFQPFDASVLDI